MSGGTPALILTATLQGLSQKGRASDVTCRGHGVGGAELGLEPRSAEPTAHVLSVAAGLPFPCEAGDSLLGGLSRALWDAGRHPLGQ